MVGQSMQCLTASRYHTDCLCPQFSWLWVVLPTLHMDATGVQTLQC